MIKTRNISGMSIAYETNKDCVSINTLDTDGVSSINFLDISEFKEIPNLKDHKEVKQVNVALAKNMLGYILRNNGNSVEEHITLALNGVLRALGGYDE